MASNKDLKLAEFYEQCKRHGYTDMHDDVQSLKAKVIATDLGLEYGRIADFYIKAEKAYDRVCAEKEQQLKEQEEIQRQRNELAAIRAVNGALLVTMSDSRASSESGTVVRVFLRPDKSIYTTIDNGDKIEGAPTITVTKGGVVKSSYNPSQTYYAGATVGGVTTGGIHQTQESISSSSIKTGTGDIQAKAGDRTITVRQVSMSRKVREAFKRDDEFRRLVTNGDMVCYNAAQTGLYGMSTMMAKASMRAGDIGTQLTQMSLAVDSARLSFEACQERAKLLTRVVSAHFPPSDLDLYNEACSWENANTSADLHKALELFEKLGRYKDSAQKAQSVRIRYQALVQEEKEKAVIRKEEDKRKGKIMAAIGIPVIVAVIAFFVIMQTVVIPRNNYNKAVDLYENGQYAEAITIFETLGGYIDSKEKAEAAKKEKKAEEDAEKEAKKAEAYAKAEAKNAEAYAEAVTLLETAQYEKAIAAFTALGKYKDSPEKVLASKYARAEELLSEGELFIASQAFYTIKDYKDAWIRCQTIWGELTHRETLSAGYYCTVGLKTDGSVVAKGIDSDDQHDLNEWSNIIAVSAGDDHIVGLKADGSVVAIGKNSNGQCNVSGWRDIVAISAGSFHTVGLKADGSVVAVGISGDGRCEVWDWSDIIAIAAGGSSTLGLKTNGSVVVVGNVSGKRRDIESWNDVTAICSGGWHFVGLKKDGRIVATWDSKYGNSHGQCDLSGWSNIVAISAGHAHTVGLMADGTVIAIGQNSDGQCNVSGWRDIVAVSTGEFFTVGLKADGSVVATGQNRGGQCDVSDWKDIKLPAK